MSTIASGIKQSDFPKYMMPFFALLMVESRLVREAKRLKEDIGDIDIEDFIDMFQLEGLGYNDFVIRKNKTLKDICKNDVVEKAGERYLFFCLTLKSFTECKFNLPTFYYESGFKDIKLPIEKESYIYLNQLFYKYMTK